jgi:hypothetical protein
VVGRGEARERGGPGRAEREHRRWSASCCYLDDDADASVITNTFFIAKTFLASSMNFFRQEKGLRDHGASGRITGQPR